MQCVDVPIIAIDFGATSAFHRAANNEFWAVCSAVETPFVTALGDASSAHLAVRPRRAQIPTPSPPLHRALGFHSLTPYDRMHVTYSDTGRRDRPV
jgi:hypothetical protein